MQSAAPNGPRFEVVSIASNVSNPATGPPPNFRPDGGFTMIHVPIGVLFTAIQEQLGPKLRRRLLRYALSSIHIERRRRIRFIARQFRPPGVIRYAQFLMTMSDFGVFAFMAVALASCSVARRARRWRAAERRGSKSEPAFHRRFRRRGEKPARDTCCRPRATARAAIHKMWAVCRRRP